MHGNRGSRGIPVPSVWQLLLLAAGACAGWLIWSEFRGLESASGIDKDAAEVAAETGLNTLRSVEALGERGPEGITELIKSLGDSNPKVRRYALLVLRRLGPQASEALDPIRELLSNEDAVVREYAVDAYWHIRRDADAVAQVVVARLGDDEARVRIAAAKVLERIGPPAIPLVVEMLQRDSAAARVTALRALRRIGWDRLRSEIDDAVRKLTGDGDPDVRAAALLTLVRWGQPQPREIRELLAQPVPIDFGRTGPDGESGPQETALSAVIRLGPDAAENLPDVLSIFDTKPDRWYMQSRMALEALRSMKSAALPAAPRLFELFDESKGNYRTEIGWTLIEICADRQEIVAKLIPLLAERDGDDCRAAGRLLAYASPEEGRRQVSALIPMISPEQIAQHRSALHAISGLVRVAQEAVPSLTVLLRQPLDDYSFWRLVETLGELGPEAASAVPVLVELLARGPATLKISLRRTIFESLALMGSAARAAVPALLSEVQNIKTYHNSTADDARDRAQSHWAAIRALALIGGHDPQVLAALRTQLRSDDERARSMALYSLLQLSPESPDLLTELLDRQPGSNYPSRDVWIYSISRMSCDRQEAIGRLMEALLGGAPETRKQAAWALGTLGSDARSALPALHEALLDWENSLYGPRSTLRVSHDNDLRNEILGSSSSRIWQSTFETRSEKRLQSEALSVRDVVRHAILKIDPAADLENGTRQ